jgi:uncharacterized membrane protein
MHSIALDTLGRLRTLESVPPQLDSAPGAAAVPSWAQLFDAAGLDISTFKAVTPQWTPPSFADTRAAWEGAYPERPDVPIRIEAAAYGGRPTWFYTIGPWTVPLRAATRSVSTWQSLLTALNVLAFLGVLTGAAILARRNVREKRADTRTATKIAAWLVFAHAIRFLVLMHHTGTPEYEVGQLFSVLGNALYLAGTLWVMYVALEPYARRLWPDGLLGWTRLLSGHFRDARVGHDVLVGVALGAVMSLTEAVRIAAPAILGQAPPSPSLGGQVTMLMGPGTLVGNLAYWTYGPLESALFVALAFVGLRFLLKNDWAALAASLLVLLFLADNGAPISAGISWFTFFSLLIFIPALLALIRYGLLVVVIGLVVDHVLTSVPTPGAPGTWAATPFVWMLGTVLTLTAFGFYAARGRA